MSSPPPSPIPPGTCLLCGLPAVSSADNLDTLCLRMLMGMMQNQAISATYALAVAYTTAQTAKAQAIQFAANPGAIVIPVATPPPNP
jgi:hypothetical protein